MATRISLYLFLIFSVPMLGQTNYEVVEQQLPYHTIGSSFTTNIVGTNEPFVVYQWQKYMEEHKGITYVVHLDEGNIELISEHVAFPLLPDELVTIHSRLSPNPSETGVLLSLWIERKDGSYFDSNSQQEAGKQIKSWLQKFHDSIMKLNQVH